MPSKPILIKNGLIVTVNNSSDIFQGDILVENSIIINIGPQITEPNATVFDASEYFITPG